MKWRVLLFALSLSMVALAQDDEGTQVLVFRNTGEVNLFYSNELDSIVSTDTDTLGVSHGVPVSQIFYARDTTMMIPVEEIDSVAIGERNVIEFNDNVKDITEDSYIVKFENNIIYYLPETPKHVLPSLGDKVYYTERDELFPYGLCAMVCDIERKPEAILVTVNDIELKELFKTFFYAGPFSENPMDEEMLMANHARNDKSGNRPKDAVAKGKITFTEPLKLGNKGNIKPDVSVGVSGRLVSNPFNGYYHADVDVNANIGVEVKYKCSENGTLSYKGPSTIRVPVATIFKLVNVDLVGNLFCELNADMNLDYILKGSPTFYSFSWTRRGDVNTFERKKTSGQVGSGKAQIDLTLNGSLFLGAQCDIDFHVIGSVVGARMTIKSGPMFSGELSMGVLTELSEHSNTSAYGNGELALSLMTKYEAGWYTKNLIFGEESYYKLGGGTLELFKKTINLFPDFQQSAATIRPGSGMKEVSVATIVRKPEKMRDNEYEGLARPLETKLALVDEEENAMAEVHVGTIPEGRKDAFGLDGSILTDRDVTHLRMQPVFEYAGYGIKASPVKVKEFSFIQPVTWYASNGSSTVISGLPYTGQGFDENTLAIAGSYIPVYKPVDSAFNKPSIIYYFGEYISTNDGDLLIGTWLSEDGVVLSFKDDSSGSINDESGERVFIYAENDPSAGNLSLYFMDESIETFTVKELTASKLTLANRKNGTKKYTKK